MKQMEYYPYIPRSTSYMKVGQYWDIPLSNGRYACGRVLQFNHSNGKRSSRDFLAGLMDWTGEHIPTFDDIAGAKLLRQGEAHIKTIQFTGGALQGYRSLELDGITPLLELSHMPTNDCRLVRGYEVIRLATLDERKTLYIQSSWGLGVIKILAEIYFVEKRVPIRKLPWEELLDLIRSHQSNVEKPNGN